MKINHACIARAIALARQRKTSHGPWSGDSIPRDQAHADSFAAFDPSGDPKKSPSLYFKFPIVAGGKVSASGVSSAIHYAKTNGYSELAGELEKVSAAIKSKDRPLSAAGSRGRMAMLRSPTAFSSNDVSVDEKAGIILGAAVMTIGPAEGHGFEIDAVTLQQALSLLLSKPDGVPMRYKHPEVKEDGEQVTIDDALGTQVGRLRNPRMAGNSIRGDIHLEDYAEFLPGLGNVKKYLLALAKSDPTQLGLSAVIFYDIEPKLGIYGQAESLPARLTALDFVDIVGRPAANPNGLLSSNQKTARRMLRGAAPLSFSTGVHMHPNLKGLLIAAGCSPTASDQQYADFYSKLAPEKKSEIDGHHASFRESNPDEEPLSSGGDPGDQLDMDEMADDELPANPAQHQQSISLPPASGGGGPTLVTPGSRGKLNARQVRQIADMAAQSVVNMLERQGAARRTNQSAMAAGYIQGSGANRNQNPTAPANNRTQDEGDHFIRQEQKRVSQIAQLGSLYKGSDGEFNSGLEAIVRQCTGANLSVKDSRTKILEFVQAKCSPVESVNVGIDQNVASLRLALPHAIMLRAGYFDDPTTRERVLNRMKQNGETVHERAASLRGVAVIEMYRDYLIMLGAPAPEVNRMSRTALANVLGPRGLRQKFGGRVAQLAESVGDFPSVLLDAMNKSLRYSYLDAPRTWPIWAQRGVAPDFKNINRVVLSESPSMSVRTSGGELQYVQLVDSKEVYVLNEYVAGIKLTRRAIINDDLDAFATIPRAQANAAARLEEDVAYAVLTANAAMSDGIALFNATAPSYAANASGVWTNSGGHGNLVSSGNGGPPSVDQMAATETLMLKQKGLAGAARLEIRPKFMLVPTSLKARSEQFIKAEHLIPTISTTSTAPANQGDANPYQNKFVVVDSVRLDDSSAKMWYLVGDYRDGQCNTVELSFLSDEPEPVVRQESDFDTEDVKFACRHTTAAKAIDFRGIVANAGQ